MENAHKQERIGSSITLANSLNISHDEMLKTIDCLDDMKNFISHDIKLANGKEQKVYDITTKGIEKIEALYQN